MPPEETIQEDEATLKAQVSQEIDQAKDLAKRFDWEQVKSGQWFWELLRQTIRAYNRNARAAYFQQKYPGLSPDEIADILASVVTRYAALAGAIAGAAATAGQAGAVASAGITAALFVSSIGGEMIYLTRLQMRLVLDLSVVYDLQLDPDDPEDMLMIFGYAMGVSPTELLGKGAQIAAGSTARYAVKKYISKGTLQAVQKFARRLGFKILQRTIIKYAVPVASAAIGSSYNYVTTASVAKIAKIHMKNRGHVTEELRALVSRESVYDLVFPAAAICMAQIDGEFSDKEHELYRAMLTRMSFDEHTQEEFQRLSTSEGELLERMAQIEDQETRACLIEIMTLMAVYDGTLAAEELAFLESAAQRLGVEIDADKIRDRAQEYEVVVRPSAFERVSGVASQAAAGVAGAAGQAAQSIKAGAGTAAPVIADAASRAGAAAVEGASKAGGAVREGASRLGGAVRDRVSRMRHRNSANTTCPHCGRELPPEFQFCPGCGNPVVREKRCSACDRILEGEFAFCPFCGAAQA
jgi:RNA polymerase subunit RPABC4/transcription elongation factor Spt4/uncharacterized tellurite resistance protein B-like protein